MADLFISRRQAESDLLSAAAYLGERVRSGDGHATVMNAVVPRYIEKGEVDLAAELANGIGDPYARDRLLIRVAEKCAALDDVEYAVQLAEAIEDEGMRSEAFERAALALAARGETARADEIAGMTLHPDNVYSGIAVHEALKGNQDAADSYLDRIQFSAARVSALQQIAAADIEAGQSEKALRSLDEAVGAASDIEHDEEKIRMLCEIASGYMSAGRDDKAVATYDSATGLAAGLDNMHRDAFLAECAVGLRDSGSEEMSEAALDLITDKTHMASALTSIARSEWDRNDRDTALDTLEEAYAIIRSQRERETRDSRGRNNVFATIAAHFALFDEFERAMETAQENPDPAKQTAALSRIAELAASKGRNEFVEQAIAATVEDADRIAALLVIADVRSNAGDRERAVTAVDEAYILAGSMAQPALKAESLMAAADRFLQYDLTGQGREAAVAALESITDIRDESSQALALVAYADLHNGAGLEVTPEERRIIDRLLQKG